MILFDHHWYLPDGETHLPEWMAKNNRRVNGRLTYQYEKYEAAMAHVKGRRAAVDCGAHCGLWTFWMARDFAVVHAFEPKPAHVQCWHENMAGKPNARLYETALGDEQKQVGLKTGPSSSGDTAVVLDAEGTPMRTLDSFNLHDLDLIKIDCEGFEAFVLEGARETIARSKPVVIVEQKPGHGQRFGRGELDAVVLLEQMGAQRVWSKSGDFVLTFRKKAA